MESPPDPFKPALSDATDTFVENEPEQAEYSLPEDMEHASGGETDPPEIVAGESQPEVAPRESAEPIESVITDTSYEDENIKITIETMRAYDTNIYVADIQISDASLLGTAFARDTFGRNIKAATSSIAEGLNAILSVNGDNYGARDAGFVLRNGALYRESARAPGDDDALLIDSAGAFHIINESKSNASGLPEAWQVFTFGPALVVDGALNVDGSSEVAYSPHSNVENPRAAIGQAGPLHYVFVVTDGRTGDSRGLTLLELANLFLELGCDTAYNLDGGGSSTMVFMGNVVNRPTSGRSIREREITDIVYIGYE